MLQLVGEPLIKNIIFTVSKYLATDYFFIAKKKNSNFIAEKPGGHHLNQAIKINITNTGTN